MSVCEARDLGPELPGHHHRWIESRHSAVALVGPLRSLMTTPTVSIIYVSQCLPSDDYIRDLDLVLAMTRQAATVRAARITEKLITPTQTAPQCSCAHGVRVSTLTSSDLMTSPGTRGSPRPSAAPRRSCRTPRCPRPGLRTRRGRGARRGRARSTRGRPPASRSQS